MSFFDRRNRVSSSASMPRVRGWQGGRSAASPEASEDRDEVAAELDQIERSLTASLATARELRLAWTEGGLYGQSHSDAVLSRLLNDVLGGLDDLAQALKRKRTRVGAVAGLIEELGRGAAPWTPLADRCADLDGACQAGIEAMQDTRRAITAEYMSLRRTA